MQETRKISELKNWKDNPREASSADMDNLRWGLKKYGMLTPLLILDDGTVIGGNHRLEILRENNEKEAWVNVVHPKNKAEMLEIALLDNQQTANWINEKLADLVDKYKNDIEIEKIKIETGSESISDLLNRISPEEIIEDEPPEVEQGEPESKLGEVYQLGRHRLMCGDATKIEDVEKLMDGNKADMVFTDPPYNVNYGATMKDKLRGTDNRKILNDSFKDNQAFYQFLYDAISALRPFVSGDVYICMSSSELHTIQKVFIDCGGHWSTFLIWVKNTFTMGRSNYQRQYEPILYGWFDGSSHYWSGTRKLGDVVKLDDANVDELGSVWLKAENLSTDIWEFPKPSKNKEHPTMKPIALCARGIINSSKRNGLVLDTFGGSGSTLIACQQTDRTCYMMELDPKYCDVIRKRYKQFTGK